MSASSDESSHQGELPPTGNSVFVTPVTTRTTFAPTDVTAPAIEGTVHAEIRSVEPHSYLIGGPVLVTSSVGAAGVRKSLRQPKRPAAPRASDLITELQEISGQVNRMMAQVERAIDRLAVHTG